jgi:hypothetical protein
MWLYVELTLLEDLQFSIALTNFQAELSWYDHEQRSLT